MIMNVVVVYFVTLLTKVESIKEFYIVNTLRGNSLGSRIEFNRADSACFGVI